MNYYKLNHETYPGITHVYFNCSPEELYKQTFKEEFPN